MYAKFSVFQSHIDLAHHYWKQLLLPGDAVIDATCGNGHDTLLLAQITRTDLDGKVYAIDIQKSAIEKSRKKIREHDESLLKGIVFVHGSHETFPEEIERESVRLAVYNLGYLPGDSKEVKTGARSTIVSLENAMLLVRRGGAISITCYPGHAEGAEEEGLLSEWVEALPPTEWSVCFHRWMNRRRAPSLMFLQRNV